VAGTRNLSERKGYLLLPSVPPPGTPGIGAGKLIILKKGFSQEYQEKH